jgi:hypothetical protein
LLIVSGEHQAEKFPPRESHKALWSVRLTPWLRAQVLINALARAAWAVIGDQFGDIGQWAAPIVHSWVDWQPGAGGVRTCQIAKFGPFSAGGITERLVQFDPIAMTFTYESAEGMPRCSGRRACDRCRFSIDEHAGCASARGLACVVTAAVQVH